MPGTQYMEKNKGNVVSVVVYIFSSPHIVSHLILKMILQTALLLDHHIMLEFHATDLNPITGV